MPKYTIFIRKDNVTSWELIPKYERSAWVNKCLESYIKLTTPKAEPKPN